MEIKSCLDWIGQVIMKFLLTRCLSNIKLFFRLIEINGLCINRIRLD